MVTGIMIVEKYMVLVCHVISQHHVTKGSGNMVRPSRLVTVPPSVVVLVTAVAGCDGFVYHVISKDHVIKCHVTL